MPYNYESNNGITKNNLAGNYWNAFVPMQVYTSLNLMHFKKNNESNYPMINRMIFEYLFDYLSPRKYEKVINIIKDYIPAKTLNNQTKSIRESGLIKKTICTWWCLDSNLNFKQRRGTYVDSNYYFNHKPHLKKGLPFDYDGFIIIETSDLV